MVVMTKEGGEARQLTPGGFNVRTRVHEYGGAPYVMTPWGLASSSRFRDQKLYRQRAGGAPEPITPEGYRYADAVPAPGSGLIAVREDHTDPAKVKNAICCGSPARSATRASCFSATPISSPIRASVPAARMAWPTDRLGLPGDASKDATRLYVASTTGAPTSGRPPGRRRRRRGDRRAAVVGRRHPDLDLRRERLLEPLRRPRRRRPPHPAAAGRVRRPALDPGPGQLRPDGRRPHRRRSGEGRWRDPADESTRWRARRGRWRARRSCRSRQCRRWMAAMSPRSATRRPRPRR